MKGPMKGYKELTDNVKAVGWTSFFTDISSRLVYTVMPFFLLSIGASKTTISLIEGIAESTASILKSTSGYWSDRLGRNKPFMLLGYGLSALATPFYALASIPAHILGLRFLERVGKGVRTAPRDSLISGSAPRTETGKAFGFHKLMDSAGSLLGPLIAFALLALFPKDFQLIFVIASIPAAIGILVILVKVRERTGSKKGLRAFATLKTIPKNFYWFIGVAFLFSLGNSTNTLLLVKANENGMPVQYIPLLFMAYQLVSLVFAIPIGKWSDRVGRYPPLMLGILLYALVYALFGLTNNPWLTVALFALYGLHSALNDGSQKALVSDYLSKESKGTGFGMYHAVTGIALLPASLVAGYLYDHVNSAAPFYFGAGMALLAALGLFYLHASKRLVP